MKINQRNPIFNGLPQAYLVGGSVRDMLRGVEPVDFDIVVTQDPEGYADRVAARLNGKVIALGKDRFTVHRVVSESLAVDVSIAKGGHIEADLLERDFTINAMACDLSSNDVIDHVGGMHDLNNRQIKMVSSGAFKADPVRLVRAFRMAATLNYEIEPHTFKAITSQAAHIKNSPAERIWAELELILAAPDSSLVLNHMLSSKLLFHVIPELSGLSGCQQNRHHSSDVLSHTMNACQALEDQLNCPEKTHFPAAAAMIANTPVSERVLLKLSVLLHDIGKPMSCSKDVNGNIHFYGHAGKGADLSKLVCRRLKIPNRSRDWIEFLIRHHQRPLSLYLARQRSALRPKTLGRFFRQCGPHAPYILIHAIADDLGKGEPQNHRHSERIDFFKELLSIYFDTKPTADQKQLISGNDLIEIFNLSPSPLFGKILKSVEELQIVGSLTDRKQTLNWVSKFIKEVSQDRLK